MKIVIPKVVVAVDMEAYAVELKGKLLYCWVNLPLKMLERHALIQADLQEEQFLKNFPDGGQKELSVDQKLEAAREIIKKNIAEARANPVERFELKRLEWYAEVLSQGPDDTRFTAEELATYEEEADSFLVWMIQTYWNTRGEHLSNKKKS